MSLNALTQCAIHPTLKISARTDNPAICFTALLICRAVEKHVGRTPAVYTLALLCVTPGMFAASTALLPSSFAMYGMTMAAASVISGRPQEVVPLAAVGIVWGWIVASIAFVPYALYVLVTVPLSESLQMAVSWLLITAAPVVVLDRYFYGAWKARFPCLCLVMHSNANLVLQLLKNLRILTLPLISVKLLAYVL